MKQVLAGVVIAVVASLVTLQFAGSSEELDVNQLAEQLANNEVMVSKFRPTMLSFTSELEEDSWLRGAARDGSPRPGPADDEKALADAANSACFLTKVEFASMKDDDQLTCSVSIDDFTGWWNMHATQGDGTLANVACHARCIVWE